VVLSCRAMNLKGPWGRAIRPMGKERYRNLKTSQ
jgi:hypothetical protein